MKIRTGFVSNSSSSSFYFLFKGKQSDTVDDMKKRLAELILKHRDYFALSFDDGGCNALDIVNCIERCVKMSEEDMKRGSIWDDGCTTTLDDMIDDHERDANYHISSIKKQEMLEKATGKRDSWQNHDRRDLQCEIKTIADLEELKKKGMTAVIKLEFGDNGGVTGNVGRSMDYEFNAFEEDDLVVKRWSNH